MILKGIALQSFYKEYIYPLAELILCVLDSTDGGS